MTDDHRPLIHRSEFRFYGQLNDFLPAARRQRCFSFGYSRTPSVRDTIQAQGVPHPEVKLILVDGCSVPFDRCLNGGERVSVYPHFLAAAFAGADKLGAPALPSPRFILDVHLGKLCRQLRLLGFDTIYGNDFEDSYIIDRAQDEQRTILTRDLGILKQGRVRHGYFVRSTDPNQQVEELLHIFDLPRHYRPLSRCIRCNGGLRSVTKDAIKHLLPAGTRRSYNKFYQCQLCRQVYWSGAHYSGLMEKLSRCGLHQTKRTTTSA
ncbi:MAG: Mut7-C RNAse domain-containing protein [Halopseudomonas sp.]